MDVILLGGSNSVVKNGLRIGLENKDITLHNYALGLSTSLQNLYELMRHENTINKSDFIISESNINDYLSPMSLNIILRNIDYFYEELYKANKTTIVLILPIPACNDKSKAINEAHRKNCAYYGFNLIDVDLYYQKNNLYNFDQNYKFHPMPLAMQELGKNIVKNLHNFKKSKENIICSKRKFHIFAPSNLAKIEHKNSFFCEKITRIKASEKVIFPKELKGCQILGIHTWNHTSSSTHAISSISIENSSFKLVKNFGLINTFQDIQNKQAICDEQTFLYINTQIIKQSEESSGLNMANEKTLRLDYVDLIGILLLENDSNKRIEYKNYLINTHEPLIPPIAFYKELALEYHELVKLDTQTFLQSQNHNLLRFLNHKGLKNEYEIFIHENNQLYGASLRIKERLSYKLGEAIMKNSKSYLGYFKIPFELRKVKKEHFKNQKDQKNLPPLKAYVDYKHAQIAKTHLPYLLGNALLQASKTPFKIGYLTLPFKLKKIAKNYKKKF
ncbi:SGNH/GDSL hydrolase family protein [Campylobacter lari]|uniref:SGNH/GDSL hydrolase family protein n=1 Tax=Campylobacter lari TaxID=201 RepID=UPI001ECC4E77|nr:SGNH/GDSL hydrolase family protein [Campylobacter lari]EHQ0819358.1 SGNH/GDSL hydrolase family protein [Campylobacter lari]MCH3696637.1 SGNH/GDSL hydrolase family protein [Campylobacter lari]MCV3331455.1 SGNH/GDSL hydrolase family protein [Campylobacter lari]MCV3344774.1 SGNH/GDSL hydrolase family protein [Campylobacter lari]MCV3361263.1 SGNH/GDSL hydrolase family protein [Campylobacter lari]